MSRSDRPTDLGAHVGGSEERQPDVFRHPDFARFWVAETVSGFGTYVTTMALQVLVVITLSGTAGDVGLLNAARWLPYLLLGLVVGALVDRRARRPLLVGTDLGRGVLLGAIPALWAVGLLNLPTLMVLMVVFGTMSLLNDAASQSFLPRLVPAPVLLAANARLDQSASVAQTTGPLVGGGLVTLLGAPLAVLVDAASYLVSGILTATISTREALVAVGEQPRNLRREIGDGLRWVYRHRVLAPFAITTHGWFLFNSMATTVFVPYALLGLDLSAFALGATFAAAGVGAVVGSLVTTGLGRRFAAGRIVITCKAMMPLAWGVIAFVPPPDGGGSTALTVAVLGGGQLLYGLAMGTENAHEMAYRQSETPDELQSRMNTTMRSINRAVIVVGAPVGGFLADAIGYRPVLGIAAGGFALVALALAASPFRDARHGDGARGGA